MTPRISLKTQAHQYVQTHLSAGDKAIDATVGNGHDTLFLSNLVGERGLVFGFDIQQQAIESTQIRLCDNLAFKNTTLFNSSHENLKKFIPAQYHGKIKAIMFNLGYLPGSDKTVLTEATSSLSALNQAVELLTPKGVITVMAYPGHAGGEDETRKIKQWTNQQLNEDIFLVKQINSSDKETAPVLYSIKKR